MGNDYEPKTFKIERFAEWYKKYLIIACAIDHFSVCIACAPGGKLNCTPKSGQLKVEQTRF